MLIKLKIYTIQEVFDMNLSGTTQAASQNKSRIAFYDDQITVRVVLGKRNIMATPQGISNQIITRVVLGKGTLWQRRGAYLKYVIVANRG
jgi:collagenase-like PrtC family protease